MMKMFDKRRRQLERAARDASSLGNVLKDLGYCSGEHIQEATEVQMERMLGEILVERGIITDEQLMHALTRQDVLRGKRKPGDLRRFGVDQRQQQLQEAAENLRRLAEVSAALADKLSQD